jgi:hypothetical protein
MSKTVVIHQPDFLPYLGFFQRFLHADQWVVLDHAQFLSGSKSWHNRDKVRTVNGTAWITVAVTKTAQKTPINRVLLSPDQSWRNKMLNRLHHDYCKSPFFAEVFPRLEELLHEPVERLVDFNMAGIRLLMELFDVHIDFVFSSALEIEGTKTTMLVDICKKVEADIYLSGLGARDYLEPHLFDAADISLKWQNFNHPVYPQLHGDFIPFLSSIDLLLNCGVEKSRDILRSCR